jgi:hypothetical protein
MLEVNANTLSHKASASRFKSHKVSFFTEATGFGERKKRDHTESSWRPLRRLRLMILRPLGVFMRDRNPWIFLRRLLLPWYVLFISYAQYLVLEKDYSRKGKRGQEESEH